MHKTLTDNQRFQQASIKAALYSLSQPLLSCMDEATRENLPPLAALTEAEQALLDQPHPPVSALEHLVQAFDLTPFERHLLLLSLGCEYDPIFAAYCAQAQLPATRFYPTLDLALRLFPEGSVLALTPDAALRYWELLLLEPEAPLLYSPLKMSPRILAYLLGSTDADTSLAPWCHALPLRPIPLVVDHPLLESLQTRYPLTGTGSPLWVLSGPDTGRSQNLVACLAQRQGKPLYQLNLPGLLAFPEQLSRYQRLLLREARLQPTLYLIEGDHLPEDAKSKALLHPVFAALSECSVLVQSQAYTHPWHPVATLTVPAFTRSEQVTVWESLLTRPPSDALPGIVQAYAGNLSFMRAVAEQCNAQPDNAPSPLATACRAQSRQHLSPLVQLKIRFCQKSVLPIHVSAQLNSFKQRNLINA